jgi:uncharacterized Tic20 family protein
MENDRLLATLVHPLSIFGSFIIPLVFFLVFKNDPETQFHSKQALNFQLTLLIAYVIGIATVLFLIGFVIIFVAGVLAIVFGIIAALKASNGEEYRIPVAIQFFK